MGQKVSSDSGTKKRERFVPGPIEARTGLLGNTSLIENILDIYCNSAEIDNDDGVLSIQRKHMVKRWDITHTVLGVGTQISLPPVMQQGMLNSLDIVVLCINVFDPSSVLLARQLLHLYCHAKRSRNIPYVPITVLLISPSTLRDSQTPSVSRTAISALCDEVYAAVALKAKEDLPAKKGKKSHSFSEPDLSNPSQPWKMLFMQRFSSERKLAYVRVRELQEITQDTVHQLFTEVLSDHIFLFQQEEITIIPWYTD